MKTTQLEKTHALDNSGKRILARGCDPNLSSWAVRAIPPMIGNPEYVATTTDEEFVEKLRTEDWSLIYFAPGACRFSAAKQPIPGGNARTEGWTLEQYRKLVRELQGDGIQIVETPYEDDALALLTAALKKAREVRPSE